MYAVQYTCYSIWRTLYIVHCIMYSVPGTIHTVRLTMDVVQCTKNNHFTLYDVHFTTHDVHFTTYSVRTLYGVQWTTYNERCNLTRIHSENTHWTYKLQMTWMYTRWFIFQPKVLQLLLRFDAYYLTMHYVINKSYLFSIDFSILHYSQ